MAELDSATLRAIIEGCYRHLTVLEEKAAMDAAFPDEEVISYLRCFYEVLHAQPIYYEQMWLAAGLPHAVFVQLMQMAEPTSGKWEVPVRCAEKFLLALVPVPGKEAFTDTILEEFTKYMVRTTRGTVDILRPQDAGTHPHRKKWQAISALVSRPEYLAGLKFYIDLWSFFGHRHEFCLARSQYGNVAPGFHRHEMAVRVAEDSVFYTRACADPSSVFPETEDFLKQTWRRRAVDRITDTVRFDMRTRMAAALKAGEESHLKWSYQTWTRARHLFGTACNEKYRVGCIQVPTDPHPARLWQGVG